MKSVYQHCNEDHLHRYLAATAFAHGVNDYMRAEIAARGIVGTRLTYRQPDKAGYANDNRPQS